MGVAQDAERRVGGGEPLGEVMHNLADIEGDPRELVVHHVQEEVGDLEYVRRDKGAAAWYQHDDAPHRVEKDGVFEVDAGDAVGALGDMPLNGGEKECVGEDKAEKGKL